MWVRFFWVGEEACYVDALNARVQEDACLRMHKHGFELDEETHCMSCLLAVERG